jgi:hypothetical protein
VTLRAFEVRWAAAIGRAFLPNGLLGGVVDDVDLGARFAEDLLASPWEAALMTRLALWLVWLAPLCPLLWRGPLSTFGRLVPPDQAALLEQLLVSPAYLVRTAALFLKLSFCSMLLGDVRALARIGAYGLGDETSSSSSSGPAQARRLPVAPEPP